MDIKQKVNKLIKRVYPKYGLQKSDVILASFPKSGNTWMRFIWANMVSITELGGREVDFKIINKEMVAEYDSHSFGSLKFDCLPRLVKSHKEYTHGAFGDNRCIYIIRHPGDVAVSYYEYRMARNLIDSRKTDLKEFLKDEYYGVPAWCRHVNSWLGNADAIIKYEELKSGATEVVSAILKEIGIDNITEEVIGKAVERSSFSSMKEKEMKRGRIKEEKFDESYNFMRKGETGEWKVRLEENEKKYIRNTIEEYGLKELYSLESLTA